jgi:sulfur carrier protein
VKVTLNGEPRVLGDGVCMGDVVVLSGAEPEGRGVAVAVDGEVVPRGEWDGFQLRDGQRIEVLQAVQGG